MLATPKGLTDEKAARMMIALREGRTLRLLGVTTPRLEAYFAAHPNYAREARPLIEANAKAARFRKGSLRRDLTHCKYGHPFSDDNIYRAPKRKERKCWACIRRRGNEPPPPTVDQVRRVTAAINAGKTIKEICWGTVGLQKVCTPILAFRKLKLHRKLNPDFDRFVLSAIADHNSKGQQRRFNPARFRIAIVRSQNDDFRKILAMVPERLANRDDIAASILEDLVSGRLRRDQVRLRLPEYISIQNTVFPVMYRKFGDSRLVSLDEVMFKDGTTTRGDTVSQGLWD
jgi:hypothetical protein